MKRCISPPQDIATVMERPPRMMGRGEAQTFGIHRNQDQRVAATPISTNGSLLVRRPLGVRGTALDRIGSQAPISGQGLSPFRLSITSPAVPMPYPAYHSGMTAPSSRLTGGGALLMATDAAPLEAISVYPVMTEP